MAESTTPNASIALYHFLCLNVVGTEEIVKTVRMMNNVKDNLHSNKSFTYITSGSLGEGLQMRGSDIDLMSVIRKIEVYEDTNIDFNADTMNFIIETKDTQSGFTKLRLEHSSYDRGYLENCNIIGSNFFLSNLSFKKRFLSGSFSTLHGPCVSDELGFFDFAHCLHSKSWITPAKKWVTRSNNSWPTYDIKQSIVKHGVLFVPVGVKGSTQEELEWRISFSVGEKLLIYSFTHTQLLCYALMKILLKDVIALDVDCKELLCSYYMKTILLWICEELPLLEWKPENLISCYMRCFRRLIYYVEFSFCPHYFIPENNLFENKIQGQAQKSLLNKLYILSSYGWQCILLSDQISIWNALTSDISKDTNYYYAKSVERLLKSFLFDGDSLEPTTYFLLEKAINRVLSSKSSKLKMLYTYYMSKSCCKIEQFLPFVDVSCNKLTYKQDKKCISALFLNTRHDAVYGWLMFASCLYKRKQYNTALYIIQYSLLKCTPEKLQCSMQFSDIHFDLFKLHVFRNMPMVQLWKFLLLGYITESEFQPDELQIEDETRIPAIVYSHFLSFLCHYQQQNSRQCLNSLRDLQLTIDENYLIGGPVLKCASYRILGIGFQLLGDIEAARIAFLHSIKLCPFQKYNSAFRKLSLLS